MKKDQAIFDRTQRLIGADGLEKLKKSRVILFGVGGVGSFVAEGLIRSGIGGLTLVDHDVIDVTNINRQIMADKNTIGREKVIVLAERLMSINPAAMIKPLVKTYTPQNADEFHLADYDYVVDAVDMVTAKIDLACICDRKAIALISCMGTGNKMDPGKFKIMDLYETSICPLAKVLRRELRKRNVNALKVLCSNEEARIRTSSPGTIAFVPSVAGLMIAGEVVRDLLKDKAGGENKDDKKLP